MCITISYLCALIELWEWRCCPYLNCIAFSPHLLHHCCSTNLDYILLTLPPSSLPPPSLLFSSLSFLPPPFHSSLLPLIPPCLTLIIRRLVTERWLVVIRTAIPSILSWAIQPSKLYLKCSWYTHPTQLRWAFFNYLKVRKLMLISSLSVNLP